MSSNNKKTTKKLKKNSSDEEEDFPFNSPYDELITGKTLSKRGLWWTAVLLLKSKPQKQDDSIVSDKPKKEFSPKYKIMIQRWQKIRKKSEDKSEIISEFWMKKKDFTLAKMSQWSELKEIVDDWIEKDLWKE
ncbi:MAG: hypothetical protein HeimC3_02940 [Candidatus Heimdallarchaeota archaeon LC_3]|nr:MAG: hypothetical protein HeimC3_02940 [Candidatus Heimdallarchaeota archaeon LC_3]